MCYRNAVICTNLVKRNSRKELVWRLCTGGVAYCGPVAAVVVRHALPCRLIRHFFLWRMENVNLAHNHPPLHVPRATSMLLILCNAS